MSKVNSIQGNVVTVVKESVKAFDFHHGKTKVSADLPTGALSVIGDAEKMDYLCGFGARQNPKRGFLFVSKVLGKHYPSRVEDMESVHRELAFSLLGKIDNNACFIGMAETAVGLAHGVYERYISMRHSHNCFIHSTRYQLDGFEMMSFEETHSHSPDQMIMLPSEGTRCRNTFDTAETLVLIDDEISTGKTLTSLSRSYLKLNSNVKKIIWVCLTDFSEITVTEVDGVPVESINLFKGEYQFTPDESLKSINLPADVNGNGQFKNEVCHDDCGRAGIEDELNFDMSALLPLLCKIKPQERVLVVGSGEWMHPAFLIGREIMRCERQKGVEVFVQSTTRSPAMIFGAIKSCMKGIDTYGDDITNYLYNVRPDDYDHILFVTENGECEQANNWCWHLNAHLCWFKDGKLMMKEKRGV